MEFASLQSIGYFADRNWVPRRTQSHGANQESSRNQGKRSAPATANIRGISSKILKSMFKRLIVMLSCVLIFAEPVQAIDGFIKITSPNSGTFTEGDNVQITWESSSNIDKVNIGYKSCPSCLDWVVFTTPNTGSYSWKVDVGNTTKTEFYLQITGYETGKGSVTSNSGTFTVNQNPPLTTGSSTTPAPTNSAASPTPNSYSGIVLPSNYPKPYPSPTPRAPITPNLSIYTLILYQEFYFEGSTTTNLKDIQDPKNVTNFTLDTERGYTFLFEEKLDLTDQKTLSALANTKEYWEYESWFVWIEWEWWIKYDITETITVEYQNESLTAYTPKLISDPRPSPATIKTKASPIPRSTPTVLGSEAGKVKLAINDGTPVKIRPRVDLDTPNSPVQSPKIELTGHTSHSDLSWTLNHNGVKTAVMPQINGETGEFVIPVDNLIKGANTFILTYQFGEEDPISLEPVTVLMDPTFWTLYGRTTLELLALTLVFVAGYFAPVLMPKIKKLLKQYSGKKV